MESYQRLVKRYSTKLKVVFKSPRKGYVIDLGLNEAIKFKQQPDTGRLLGNAVAIELFAKEQRSSTTCRRHGC